MIGITREDIAKRAAQDIPDGAFVNLGIGLPTMIPDFVPKEREFILHSENGILAVGPTPPKGAEDWNLINAGKQPVTILPGGAFFDSVLSFTMMRGGRLTLAVLGAFEVSAAGDLANWWTGEPDTTPAVGGAMDLACGAQTIWVLMDHMTKKGAPKIVERCSYPLTAARVVRRIYTDLAVIDVTVDGLVVTDVCDDLDFKELQVRTGAPLKAALQMRVLSRSKRP